MINYFYSILLLLFVSSNAFWSIINYEIIDIGVLSADESEGIAINNKAQVLGKLKHEGKWDVFL